MLGRKSKGVKDFLTSLNDITNLAHSNI
jgi:hypothetical protein